MKRTDLLIKDVKFDANEQDSSRFTSMRLAKYFSDAQKKIHAIMFEVIPDESTLFPKEKFYDLTFEQEFVTLPSDIYAKNSIISVGRSSNTSGNPRYYSALRKISESERRIIQGYFVFGNKIGLSPLPRTNLGTGLRIVYEKKLPTLSPRIGKIASIVGQTITLSAPLNEPITDYSDFFCVVDGSGEIQNFDSNGDIVPLQIASYVGSTGTLIAETGVDLSGFAVNQYVVSGEYATSHSELLDECEELLISYVDRKIQKVDSSSDVQSSVLFTEEDRAVIESLMAENFKDSIYPAIVDTDYLNY